MTITVGEITLESFECPVCHMKASDRQTILVCETKHEAIADYMSGNSGMSYYGRRHGGRKMCVHRGCDKKAMARGYCGYHYMAQWASGE